MACSSFHAMLFCCQEVLLGLFCQQQQQQQQQQQPSSISHEFFHVSHLRGFRRDIRQLFGVILWLVRPSVPCCFAPGRCFWYSSVSSSSSSSSSGSSRLVSLMSSLMSLSSSSVSEGTLGSFSVRFCGVFVLPCHAVLLPGGAFGTLLSAAATAAAV